MAVQKNIQTSRGIRQVVNGATNATQNTWDEVFPEAEFRNTLFIQNISDTDMEVGIGDVGAEVRIFVLAAGDDKGFSVESGIPNERIAIRCPSASGKEFVAWFN